MYQQPKVGTASLTAVPKTAYAGVSRPGQPDQWGAMAQPVQQKPAGGVASFSTGLSPMPDGGTIGPGGQAPAPTQPPPGYTQEDMNPGDYQIGLPVVQPPEQAPWMPIVYDDTRPGVRPGHEWRPGTGIKQGSGGQTLQPLPGGGYGWLPGAGYGSYPGAGGGIGPPNQKAPAPQPIAQPAPAIPVQPTNPGGLLDQFGITMPNINFPANNQPANTTVIDPVTGQPVVTTNQPLGSTTSQIMNSLSGFPLPSFRPVNMQKQRAELEAQAAQREARANRETQNAFANSGVQGRGPAMSGAMNLNQARAFGGIDSALAQMGIDEANMYNTNAPRFGSLMVDLANMGNARQGQSLSFLSQILSSLGSYV